MTHLILGSGSPRRKEILDYFSLPFEQKTSNYDEESLSFDGNPLNYVSNLAHGKLIEIKKANPDAIILTADTVVFCEGKVYNKPKTEDEAFKALTELSGKWHSVFTAVCLYSGDRLEEPQIFQAVEETRVLFNALTPNEIRHYHSKIHWTDKAGGYAIQMGAGLIVNKIDGCFYNVMGLPINTVRRLLKNINIELWDYVK